MNMKIKLAVMASGLILGVSGAAFAATGHLPAAVTNGISAITGSSVGGHDGGTATTGQYGPDGGAAGHQYDPGDQGGGSMGDDHSGAMNQYGDDDHDNHGMDVSTVARDHEAEGTMTLPNGDEVENHGMAVKGAAHDQGDDPATPPATTPTQPVPPAMGAPGSSGGDDGETPSAPAMGTGTGSNVSSGGGSHMGGRR